MPIAMITTAGDVSSPSPRQVAPRRDEAERAVAASTPAADVLVSLSAAGQAAAAPAAANTTEATPAAAPATIATPVTPAGAGARANLTPDPTAAAASRASPGAPDTGSAPAPREPDGATTQHNQAVQLYLDNAARPDSRPQPSAIRASA
ncbi:MAG TPA: hypothetical protein PL143_07065 [Rhodocyclaceae bacterium]|nr:hypothetical protein [Rhodocyclaceae bacterium]